MDNTNLTTQTSNVEIIKKRIYVIRGQRVMLDRDLAELYGVETRVLNQAVRRNIERFPEDFMFQLNNDEWHYLMSQFQTLETTFQNMSSQFVMTSPQRRPKSALPYAFTEHGTIMLASILRSSLAIQMSVMITRAFIAMREAISGILSMNLKMEQISHKVDQLNSYVEEILHDQNDINRQQEETNTEIALQIEALNDALDQLRAQPETPRKRIGFRQGDKAAEP